VPKKKVVAIHWRDPTIDSGWVEDDTHDKDLPINISYGVLISKGTNIVIAGTVNVEVEKDRYADRTKFPKGCVDKIEIIGEVTLK